MPQPEVLGRNGTYVVFRKLHQRVAAFRRYLKENARSPDDEELLAAKMMGRWRSGAPLALCPLHDDPGARRRSAPQQRLRLSRTTRPATRRRPASHIRRANPRDASVAGVVRLHRMIRRGTAYGPELPEGVLEDDGVDRGLMFAFVGAHLGRQFEFVQSEWINGGEFLGLGDAKDPIAGAHDGAGAFSIPRRPIPQAPARPAAVRRHARRRVLLHARAARAALARRASDMKHATRGRRSSIGAGPAGLLAALRAGRPRRHAPRSSRATSSAAWPPTTDRFRCGRSRTRPGCIRDARQLGRYGIAVAEPVLDYPRLLARVREVVDDVRAHAALRAQIDAAGVTVHEHAGAARFVDPHTVETAERAAAPRRQDHPLHGRRRAGGSPSPASS